MKNKKVKFIVDAAVIAALYVVLTYLAAAFNLSSGVIQVRFSEALTILPVFTPAAIPGLFVGCILANALTGAVVIDVICGSIATLIGAVGAWLIGKYVMNRLKYAYFLAPLAADNHCKRGNRSVCSALRIRNAGRDVVYGAYSGARRNYFRGNVWGSALSCNSFPCVTPVLILRRVFLFSEASDRSTDSIGIRVFRYTVFCACPPFYRNFSQNTGWT